MKANTKRISLIIAGVITLFIISFFGIKQYLYGQSKLALTQIDAAISAQELLLVKLADITRVNGADAPTERIIVDCKATQRQRFDVLLDSLSGAITAVELAEPVFIYSGRRGDDFSDGRKTTARDKKRRQNEPYVFVGVAA